MSGKYMKTRKIVIPTLTLIILASQMFSCASTSKEETLDLIQNTPNIEIEVSEQAGTDSTEDQATIQQLDWTILADLTTNPTLRESWETILKIKKTDNGKEGVLYVNENNAQTNNNTLYVAMHNVAFRNKVNQTLREELAAAAAENYADIDSNDDTSAIAAGINAYFNLLPDRSAGYANADSTLTRAEFMALLYRATNPVEDIVENEAFTNKVGATEYNIYAQNLERNSFIELDKTSYTGTMTRAEAVYMLMSKYFPGALKSVDTSTATCYNDTLDGGDITLSSAIANPENGLPTDLYKALCIAKDYNFIEGEDSRWDEPITLSESINLMMNVFQIDSYMDHFDSEPQEAASTDTGIDTGTDTSNNKPSNTISPTGDITVTPSDYSDWLESRPFEERARDAEDGILGIDVKIDPETGQSIGIDLLTGETYHLGDVTVDGAVFIGRPAYNVQDYIWQWRHGDGSYYDDETPEEFIIERWNFNYGPNYNTDDIIHGRN